MRRNSKSNGHSRFILLCLPWLVAMGMLATYAFTLNSWISPDSLGPVADATGLSGRLELLDPVTRLAAYPLGWLPLRWIPLALNLFMAVCGALTLACLARSVMLLPRDRVQFGRRGAGEQDRSALCPDWLPPVLAVLVCGFQLTFWEHAITGTGEMVDLLFFAGAIWCLLEFRSSRKDSWLVRFAFIYGLGMADNWALVAYAPAFLIAALWMTGLHPFHMAFLERVAKGLGSRGRPLRVRLLCLARSFDLGLLARVLICLAAGLSSFFALPLVASLTHPGQVSFAASLRFAVRAYHIFLTYLPARVVLVLCLTSLVPVFFMGLRWGRIFGRWRSQGVLLSRGIFHLVHVGLLAICLWDLLDGPASPRRLGLRFPCLPVYYLCALGVGYYSGYFLLLFARMLAPALEPGPFARRLRWCAAGGLGLLLTAIPAGLITKNLPDIAWKRNGPLLGYAEMLERSLPRRGAVVFSDDVFRLECLRSALIRSGKQREYLLVDTTLLTREPAACLESMRRGNPGFALGEEKLPDAKSGTAMVVRLAERLGEKYPLFCLHPVMGKLLGESFEERPCGLLYRLVPQAGAKPMSQEIFAENQAFWRTVETEQMPGLIRHIRPPEEQSAPAGRWQRAWQALRGRPERKRSAVLVGGYYAQALDGWGVELQRAGRLLEAGRCFEQAEELNPDNVVAQINREVNFALQARRWVTGTATGQIYERLGRRRSWEQILLTDGPIDEPACCRHLSAALAQAGFHYQARRQFERAKALEAALPDGSLWLAQ